MFEKVFVITRKTRLAELVERFNTVGQARFYIEHAGGDFGEYEREDAVYRSAVEATRRSLPSELKVHALDRSLVPTVLFTEKDLIVTLGQDGVVANTAKYVKGQPIIAVNPDPERFDGILMPFSLTNVRDAITAVLGGKERMREVTMAEARLQDELSALVDQATRYPFLSSLKPVADRVAKLSQKDYTFLLTNLSEYEPDLLAAKEDLIAPIKTFMRGSQRTIYDDALEFLRGDEANFVELPDAEIQPLRYLASSDHPYKGNILPLAKAAATKVRGLLADLLDAERVKATQVLATHEARLETILGFSTLSESARSQVLAATVTARESVQSARFVSGIRDRVQRYVNQEYPAQVALADRLVAPPPPPPKAPPVSGQPPRDPIPEPIAPPPPVAYIPASSLQAKCSLPYISTAAELDQWLDALRVAAEDELKKGNRITL